MVTTIDASMGEVMDRPTKKGNWFNVNENNDAKNRSSISFTGTFSFFVNSDMIQKRSVPPDNRKKVSVYGLKISGIKDLEMGLLSPKITLAMKRAIWPVSFLFFIIHNNSAKI
jgi:hypothetical protein